MPFILLSLRPHRKFFISDAKQSTVPVSFGVLQRKKGLLLVSCKAPHFSQDDALGGANILQRNLAS